MRALRKVLAFFIMAFVCIPMLIGIIWAVGTTRAVVSHKFLSSLPREIIERIPDFIDEVITEVSNDEIIVGKNIKTWVKAVADTGTTPKQLLIKTGLLDWFEKELSVALEELGRILKGEVKIHRIVLNLRPLKKALKHEAIREYIINVLKKLPPCSEEELNEWARAVEYPRDLEDLPACRPVDLDKAILALNIMQSREIDEIPDEIDFIEDTHHFPRNAKTFKFFVSLTYLLFLIPAFFIIMTALIGGTERGGALKWIGISTAVSGILAYALSFFLKNIIPWAAGFAYEYDYLTHFQEAMIDKASEMWIFVLNPILEQVNFISGIVFIIGIVFFAISYFSGSRSRGERRERSGDQAGSSSLTQEYKPSTRETDQ